MLRSTFTLPFTATLVTPVTFAVRYPVGYVFYTRLRSRLVVAPFALRSVYTFVTFAFGYVSGTFVVPTRSALRLRLRFAFVRVTRLHLTHTFATRCTGCAFAPPRSLPVVALLNVCTFAFWILYVYVAFCCVCVNVLRFVCVWLDFTPLFTILPFTRFVTLQFTLRCVTVVRVYVYFCTVAILQLVV